MTIAKLRHMVTEAAALAGEHPCVIFGHNWASFGGRACPICNPFGHSFASQTAYQCKRCGAFDYGERDGPGYEDCRQSCRGWKP